VRWAGGSVAGLELLALGTAAGTLLRVLTCGTTTTAVATEHPDTATPTEAHGPLQARKRLASRRINERFSRTSLTSASVVPRRKAFP
jgi:hypothetical protein